MKATLSAATALAAAAMVAPTNDTPPLPPETTITIQEAAPSDGTPPLPVTPDDQAFRVGADPSRVGLIRLGNGTTEIVEFSRPSGVADSCQHTVCNAPAGSRWIGVDDRSYEKMADGSFFQRPTAQDRADGVVPVKNKKRCAVGTWGTARIAADDT